MKNNNFLNNPLLIITSACFSICVGYIVFLVPGGLFSGFNTPETSLLIQLSININDASVEELVLLPGIGETRALAIVNYRDINSSFKLIQDIQNVPGIGHSVYENIKEFICV